MKTVLVVDDNAVNQELITELLDAWGFTVLRAGSGLEALSMLERESPDLMLLDLQMPDMDGYKVIRQVRDNPRRRELPVVAVTAYAMTGDREHALESGFDGYLTKPLDFNSLRVEVQKWCPQ